MQVFLHMFCIVFFFFFHDRNGGLGRLSASVGDDQICNYFCIDLFVHFSVQLFMLSSCVCTVILHGGIGGLGRLSAPVGDRQMCNYFLCSLVGAIIAAPFLFCTVFLHGGNDNLGTRSAPVGVHQNFNNLAN